MVQMIRKQVYIQRQQEAALKRLSQSRGLSEAELIRQAIDRQAGSVAAPFVSDAGAWEEAHTFMLALRDSRGRDGPASRLAARGSLRRPGGSLWQPS